MAAQYHNKLNSRDLGSYRVLWMSSSYVYIFVKLYQRQSLERQPGRSGQCRSSRVYLSTLDRPCSYETKHRTHLREPQSGCSGQCRSSRPVMCISAPLTTRAATRQNTEHTCVNHSQAHKIKRPFTAFTRIINMLCFSLSISHMTQYKIKVFILFNYTISLIVHIC